MILTKKEIRKIGAFNLENVNETPQMAKQGQVGILIKLANKQLQNVFSLHKRGKNKEAKVVLNNKVYSTMEYISRAFKTLGESVNEKTISIGGEDLMKYLMKRFKMSKSQAIASMKKHKMDMSFLKKESVNEGISVSDERHFGKKGIIIMIDDNGKKVSAIFKDKKNAKEFNRNKPSDIKKLLQLAKKAKYPKAIDESVNEGNGVEKILKMADEKSFGKIAGRTVDGMTAGLFKAVYDKAPQNSKDKIDKSKEKTVKSINNNIHINII